MRKQFYEHQRKAFAYAIKEQHPALFMEMRLGKNLVTIRTSQTYAPLDPQLGLRSLIAAPNSAIDSWMDELEDEGIERIRLQGTKKKRNDLLNSNFYEGDGRPKWFLVNRECWQTLPTLPQFPWDMAGLDESTFIKSARAKVTKFFLHKDWCSVPHRWLLTGTPCPEGVHEYVCQMIYQHGSFMRCNSFWQWRARYMEPDPFTGYGEVVKWGVRDEVARAVAKTALVMRRKDAKLKDPKVYEKRTFDLSPKIRKAYKQMEKDFLMKIDGKEIRTMWTGAQWQALRQLCSGFVEGELIWDGKVKELKSLLNGELKNEQVVVWCCYNDEVRTLTKRIKGACMMLGATKEKIRTKLKNDFHAGKFNVFIIQQELAQAGANLSCADTMIYFSSPPGAMARQQTEDRTITVEKMKKGIPQLILDLVAKDSVDEDVWIGSHGKKAASDLALARVVMNRIKERSR